MVRRIINLLNALCRIVVTRGSVFSYNISTSSHIGKNVVIKRGSVLCANSSVGDNCLIYRNVVVGEKVKIGEFSSINDGTVIETGSIGKACSIGVDCIISPGVHTMDFFTTSSLLYKKRFSQPVHTTRIGNDVWIGSRSIIMRGVTIGDGAVIGANAVVTKDVPPYAVVAGVPARIIKYRFNEDLIDRIENMSIWNDFPANKNLVDELIEEKEGFKELLYTL